MSLASTADQPPDAAPVDTGCAAERRPTGGKMRLLTLAALDGRTTAAKRARDLIGAMEQDLGGGDLLSEGQKQLVQRAAVLGTFIESCEATWLAGDETDLGEYLAAINAQRRVLATIGLDRRAKDVSPAPSLRDRLMREASQRAAEAATARATAETVAETPPSPASHASAAPESTAGLPA